MLFHPAVPSVLFPDKEAKVQADRLGSFMPGVLPQVCHVFPVLAHQSGAQDILQLMGGRNVKDQCAARHNRSFRRAEKTQQVFFGQQVINAVTGSQYGINGPVQVQAPHILLYKRNGNPVFPGFLGSLPEHFTAQVHACHLEAPALQRECQASGPAGAFAYLSAPYAVNRKQAGIMIRPAFVIDVIHQFIIEFSKSLVHGQLFVSPSAVSSSSSSSSSSGV